MTRAARLTALLGAGVAIACAAAWIYAWRARDTNLPRPRAPVHADVERVPAAGGSLVLADGRRLTVRIAPLHAEPARQSFDAAALRARFGLGEGEPFSCLVELQAATPAPESERGFDLTGARIEDERGLALASFPPARAADHASVVDPLAALAAPPSAALAVESRVSLLMWGRAPGAAARFESCCDQPVPLQASDLPSREVQTTLARIRRADAAPAEAAVESR
jgi:hypothetical protein